MRLDQGPVPGEPQRVMSRLSVARLTALALMLASCHAAPAPSAAPAPVAPPRPAWLDRVNGAFTEDGHRWVFGVGKVANISNRALASTTAMNRARAEATKVMEELVGETRRAVMASRPPEPEPPTEEQVDVCIWPVRPPGLEAIRIVDIYLDNGEVHALAMVDMNVILAMPEWSAMAENGGERIFDAFVKPTQAKVAFPIARPAKDADLCHAELTLTESETQGSCARDPRVTQNPGVLVYPCAGGPATAWFGLAQASGTMRDGRFDLTLNHDYAWRDCTWHVRNTWQSAESKGELRWVVEEVGEGCAKSCRMEATMRVTVTE